MNEYKKSYYQLVETLIGVFTADKGSIKILLMRKKVVPYKGYWILPGNMVSNQETLENNVSDVAYDRLGIPSLYIEQGYTFSNLDRDPNDRIIATTFIGLIDSTTLQIKQEPREDIELAWFDINQIPKLGYDHEKVVLKLTNILKSRIVNSNILKLLFPSDFTLPELQRAYEQILNKQLDRRNFRKKFVNFDLIEDTKQKTSGNNGRPAKLYRFKEDMREINLY